MMFSKMLTINNIESFGVEIIEFASRDGYRHNWALLFDKITEHYYQFKLDLFTEAEWDVRLSRYDDHLLIKIEANHFKFIVDPKHIKDRDSFVTFMRDICIYIQPLYC